jgi:hypothetical protein
MRTTAANSAIAERPEDRAALAALARRRLKELDRLRDLAFLQAEQLVVATRTIPEHQLFDRMVGPKGGVAEMDRFARCIRQIMVLEFEIRGLFKAPDRDAPRKLRLVKSDRPGFEPPDLEDLLGDLGDVEGLDVLDIRTDYRAGPLDEVVAGIREVLGAEPPVDDPFAPPPGRKPREAAPAPERQRPPQPAEPAMKARTEPAKPAQPDQRILAVKAATLAIKATGGNGFRVPSAKPRKPRRPRRQIGRGPPR